MKDGELEKKLEEIVNSFLETSKGENIEVISHFDTDGITSAAIMIQALKRLDQKFSLRILKGLTKEIINSLDKFMNLLKTHKKGFFVLDSWDNIVPDDIREYCHKNLKRELEVDRLYPVQPRYWTVWVYSWGLK